ncbi:HK97 gp10 family phage protein [Micromonospora chalcea]|uniref:HK97 gp10 family phage protein n=1 Tax=Micromonospora chalcea TaxID=1874 RepID=UPI003814ED91
MARVVWNHAEAERLLNSQAGPVGRDLHRRGRTVERGAKRRCPVSEDGSNGNPPGHLRDSITASEVGRDAAGLYVDVGTDVDYALPVELGSRPHVIESGGDYPLRNPKTGQVFGRRVNHPGTKAQPYLRPALDDLRGE